MAKGNQKGKRSVGARLRARVGGWIRRRWNDPRLKKPKRIAAWGAAGLVALLVLSVASAALALRLAYSGDLQPGTQTRGRDAVWLGHAWVDGRNGEAELAALAEDVNAGGAGGIRDLYVHAGPLEDDGTLRADRYPRAEWFIENARRAMRGVRVQAWLGDDLATEGGDGMVLGDEAVRAEVVRSTEQVLELGFDGVHFDLEPVHSGDEDFLALLDELGGVTGEPGERGVPLSVAAHQIDPLPGLHSLAGSLTGHPKWWSQEYFGDVARRVDQIAVMSYDTGMPFESLYGGYVAQQTQLAVDATPAGTDLLMGLPAFHENRFGHREAAETVAAAVRGVRLGLGRADRDRERFGVALYVDFAATAEDWEAYRRGWCGGGGGNVRQPS